MAFLVFERRRRGSKYYLSPTSESFSLAGYNLIYHAWEIKGCPIGKGWHVTADDLIRIHSSNRHSFDTQRLVVDFAPGATRLIGLIEILDIYAYSYKAEVPGEVEWTPLMLHMRDVLFEEYGKEITPEEKAEKIASIPDTTNNQDFIEFLYLHGTDRCWNWGKSGRTNAAFIQGEARKYFYKYFLKT